MPAITKDRLLLEKAQNQQATADLRGRLAATERQVALLRTELHVLAGAGQMVDHLLKEVETEETPSPGMSGGE